MVKYLDNNSGFSQWNAARNASSNRTSSRFTTFLWYFVLILAAWWLLGLMLTPRNQATDATDPVSVVDVSAVPTTQISSQQIAATVQGIRISDIELTDFAADAKTSDTATPRVTLFGADNNFIEVGLLGNTVVAPSATTVWQETDNNTYTWRGTDGVSFARSVMTDGYLITITDTVTNNSANIASFTPYARIARNNDMASSAGVDTGLVAYVNSDTEYANWHKLDKKSYAFSTISGFVGFADQYWETVVSLESPDQTMRAKKIGDTYIADVAASPVAVAPNETRTITTNIFAGPRDQNVLNGVSGKITGLNKTVDYGWFGFLARPMLWILNGLNSIVMNYGLAIIIMTIFLRLLMWPLTRKSYTSMITMQKMQPEISRIQKLYSNDKARMQIEMMRLYQTHKTSPMSGCLPMLIQIPIFFALYKALLVSVQMRGAHFLWISDLAAMDPYFILPIIMGGTMWLQQYLQSGAQKKIEGDGPVAQTQRVMKWMPVIFTIMFAWMPAGLVLYWTVSNIFGIIQMYIIKHNSPK